MRILPFLLVLLLSHGTLGAQQQPAPDLYTLELIGTPELRRFGGLVEMRPAASPFTTSVTAAGEHRWDVLVTIDSLPAPATLGDYTTFVVWAAPPTMRPMVRLGVVAVPARGAHVGTVAFNRFTVFVSAEPSADVEAPSGPFVLRGLSPSMRMGAAHLVQASSSPVGPAAHAEHGAHTAVDGGPAPAPGPGPNFLNCGAALAPAPAPAGGRGPGPRRGPAVPSSNARAGSTR